MFLSFFFLGLTSEDTFKIIDSDFDGVISKEDLKKFLMTNLEIKEY